MPRSTHQLSRAVPPDDNSDISALISDPQPVPTIKLTWQYGWQRINPNGIGWSDAIDWDPRAFAIRHEMKTDPNYGRTFRLVRRIVGEPEAVY